MNSDKPAVKRVTTFLTQHDIDVEIRELADSARTAADAAAACPPHCADQTIA